MLQGPLTNLGAASAAAAGDVGHPGALPVGGVAEVAKVYDKARGYYTLVGMPGDELVRMASKTPLRYSVAEWQALLQVKVAAGGSVGRGWLLGGRGGGIIDIDCM
jgi:hypothetical protein